MVDVCIGNFGSYIIFLDTQYHILSVVFGTVVTPDPVSQISVLGNKPNDHEESIKQSLKLYRVDRFHLRSFK